MAETTEYVGMRSVDNPFSVSVKVIGPEGSVRDLPFVAAERISWRRSRLRNWGRWGSNRGGLQLSYDLLYDHLTDIVKDDARAYKAANSLFQLFYIDIVCCLRFEGFSLSGELIQKWYEKKTRTV